MFSWPGNTSFRLADMAGLVGGGTTTVGEFAWFPITILISDLDPSRVSFNEGGFKVEVPATGSHLLIRGAASSDLISAYTARFVVDTRGQIRQLDVTVSDPPKETGLRRVHVHISYQELIPSEARTTFEWPDGSVATNKTTYLDCHQFRTDSSINFGKVNVADPIGKSSPSLPPPVPGTEIQIALLTPIDSDRDLTGQPLEGRLVRDWYGAGNALLAKRGALIRGRIMRLERYHCPISNFVLGIKFEALDLNDGVTHLQLEPPPYQVPQGRSSRSGYIPPAGPEMALVPEESRPGVQCLLFRDRDRLKLKPGLVTTWRVPKK